MLLAFAVLVSLASAGAMEVYLRELTVFTSHESSFFADKPEVYFDCEDDRLPVLLRDVREVDKKYRFGEEQIPATHLKEGECVLCTLKEFDILSADDVYGKMRLCAENFKTGISEVNAAGEFHARFDCPECKKGKHETAVNCREGRSSASAVTNSVTTHSVASASASTTEHSSEGGKSKGVSTVAVVFISLAVFVSGVAVGAMSLKYISGAMHQREETRTHELNSMLSQTDVPFEALPKGASKTASRTRGVATYQQLPSDEAGNAP